MVQETFKQNTIDYDMTGQRLDEASAASIPGLSLTTNFKPRYSNNPKKEKGKRKISRFIRGRIA